MIGQKRKGITRNEFHELPEIERRFHIFAPIASEAKAVRRELGQGVFDGLSEREKLAQATKFMHEWWKNDKTEGNPPGYHPQTIFETGGNPKCTAFALAGKAFLQRLGFDDVQIVKVYDRAADHAALTVHTKMDGDITVDPIRNRFGRDYPTTRVVDETEMQLLAYAQDSVVAERIDAASGYYGDLIRYIEKNKDAKDPLVRFDMITARVSQGLCRFYLKDYKAADEALRQAEALKPEEARDHWALGVAYEMMASEIHTSMGAGANIGSYVKLGISHLNEAKARGYAKVKPAMEGHLKSLMDINTHMGPQGGM